MRIAGIGIGTLALLFFISCFDGGFWITLLEFIAVPSSIFLFLAIAGPIAGRYTRKREEKEEKEFIEWAKKEKGCDPTTPSRESHRAYLEFYHSRGRLKGVYEEEYQMMKNDPEAFEEWLDRMGYEKSK